MEYKLYTIGDVDKILGDTPYKEFVISFNNKTENIVIYKGFLGYILVLFKGFLYHLLVNKREYVIKGDYLLKLDNNVLVIGERDGNY